MSEAELAAVLPPALLRVMACAEAADEVGRFMAWAAALQLFSHAPPTTQARLSAHWRGHQLPELLHALLRALPLEQPPTKAADPNPNPDPSPSPKPNPNPN